MSICFYKLSSLAKVFLDEEPTGYMKTNSVTLLKNELAAFQIAYNSDCSLEDVTVAIRSQIAEYINIYSVGYTPSLKPAPDCHDDYCLRDTPGLYPDILYPYSGESFHVIKNQWRSLWFEIDAPTHASCGTYPVYIEMHDKNGDTLFSTEISVDILDAVLPEQSLICTNWFHCDSLAVYYNSDVFSDAFWQTAENFISTAVKHGINCILTPLFTPPLDTQIGGERLTVQLIDVYVRNGTYSFGFDNFKKWVEMCKRRQVKYYEMSHLFTQWGAGHAPKIMADADGEYKRIFGWETDSAGKAYADFLRALAPELIRVIKELKIEKNCLFHISDEPSESAMKTYAAASKLIHELFGQDFKIIDALSDVPFYEKGLVTTPVPSITSALNFYDKVPERWVYYCCSPYDSYYTNRFFSMPSQRTRILGMQLYKYQINGFLQWGYNFYFTHHAIRPVDPFAESDAGMAFPSGDAYVVYPGADKQAIPSIRLKIFNEALQDMRACQLLESVKGKNAVLDILNAYGELTFTEYPKSEEIHLNMREKINRMIAGSV